MAGAGVCLLSSKTGVATPQDSAQVAQHEYNTRLVNRALFGLPWLGLE